MSGELSVRESIGVMEWFIAVIAVAALGVAAMAAAGGMGQMSKDPVHDTYRQALPDRPLTAADLEQLRFGIALRGYAMGQVDDLLDRLSGEIATRDARIAELMGLYAPAGGRDELAGARASEVVDTSEDTAILSRHSAPDRRMEDQV